MRRQPQVLALPHDVAERQSRSVRDLIEHGGSIDHVAHEGEGLPEPLINLRGLRVVDVVWVIHC
jgi:hypothetical protein